MSIQSIEDIKSQFTNSAKEIKEIDNFINGQLESDATISATSDSSTSEIKALRILFAFLSWLQQNVINNLKVDIRDQSDRAAKGNSIDMHYLIKQYQYGQPLLIDPVTRSYYYDVIDQELQIISNLAIIDQNGQAVIKAAKSVNGIIQKLSVDEYNGLVSYIRKIQPLGSNLSIRSNDPDQIILGLTIRYDAINLLSVVRDSVKSAILDYLNNLEFDGTFRVIRLIDYIQQVQGVKDVIPYDLKSKNVVQQNFVSFDRSINPYSGYITINDDNDLDSTLIFEPS